jgi:molybdopterin-dependent oxidoreductase alpha subunit
MTDKPKGKNTGLRQRPYSGPAAGRGALWAVIDEARRHTGLVRAAKLLGKVNQTDGFDCPGCAWPDPNPGERTRFEFCENGAKAVIAEGTVGRVGPEFFAEHSVQDLAERSGLWLEAQGRLTHPMVLRPGASHYEVLSWEDAFQIVGSALRDLPDPNGAIFYTSGRTSNEAAFLYQLMARAYGTNNLPDCSNMCHESSGRGLTQTIGIGKGTVGLDDFEVADAIFVIGQNPGTNHPRMLTALESAVHNGCTVVSVNPLRERGLERFAHPQKPLALLGGGTPLSSLYLQVRVNGDVALLKGIMKAVIEAEDEDGGVLDLDFIQQHTRGFEAFADEIRAQNWETLVERSGISEDEIREAAGVYMASSATILCWAMGLTQHKNGVANIQECVNLLLLKGNLGRAGAGACPVRGHSNVQGDRTMGIVERPPEALLAALERRFGFSPPSEHGVDTVGAIHAMHEGRATVFVGMGGNFVSAAPDTVYTEEALRRCAVTVQVSTKLNRSHLVPGKMALILPCLGRTEIDEQSAGAQFVTCENSMSVVQSSRGHAAPASEELMSEVGIVAGIAAATLGPQRPIDWAGAVADYDCIRGFIEDCIPGFERYNERVRRPGGFVLPNGVRDRVWKTASGRAEFTVHPIPEWSLGPGEYLMATVRSHDQYNTTIYGNDDRYRGIYGERRVVMMGQKDIAAAGLEEGQPVDLVSHFEGEERTARDFVVVRQSLPRRCVATYFPEANVLIPVGSVADGSNTPTSKSVVVTIRPGEGV